MEGPVEDYTEPTIRYRVLPFFAVLRKSEANVASSSIASVPQGPDSKYTCERCGDVEFYDLSLEWLEEQGYDAEYRVSELSVIMVHHNEQLPSIATSTTSSCGLCKYVPYDHRSWYHWLPTPLQGSEFAESIYNSLEASGRLITGQRKSHLIVYICAYGTEGLLVPQPVPSRFNRYLAKAWLNDCKMHHGIACGLYSSLIEGMRLIDCDTMSIVQAESSCVWLALSYVWGVQHPVDPHDLSQMPKTIRDAVTITKELGYRYLWVDQYCISQGDAAQKQQQIRNMDRIYRGADITIVAASGASSEAGIHGISPDRISIFQTFKIGGRVVSTIKSEPVLETIRSRWWQRAWTFQEAFLSKRLLVFTQFETSFYCQTTAWTESLGGLEHITSSHGVPWATLRLDCGLFTNNNFYSREYYARRGQYTVLPEYLHLVAQYTQRKLSIDSDALHAFAGVLKTLQETAPELNTFSGLPLISSLKDAGARNSQLFTTMSWFHEFVIDPLKRRNEFPSWTWAGWIGRCSWLHVTRAYSFMLDVRFCSEHSIFEPPYLEDAQHMLDSVKSIKFKAPVVPCAAFAALDDDPSWHLVTVYEQRIRNFDAIEGLGKPSYFRDQIDRGKWSCFLLGKAPRPEHPNDGPLFILVVEWHDANTAERICGLITRQKYDNFDLDLDQHEWRTVNLA